MNKYLFNILKLLVNKSERVIQIQLSILGYVAQSFLCISTTGLLIFGLGAAGLILCWLWSQIAYVFGYIHKS